MAAAKIWHGTAKGREWHKQHYREMVAKLHGVKDFICQQCGRGYSAKDRGGNRFCSAYCKTKYRKASGVDDEKRICVVCGGEFMANRYVKKQTCTRKCAVKLLISKRSRKE
jgi:hypothetical protein